MKPHRVTMPSGETLTLYQTLERTWCCPVCGSPELPDAPYLEDGGASFQMCSCGFEFGFDDDPGASAQALPSVEANFNRWRAKVLAQAQPWPEKLAALRSQLAVIGITREH